MPRVPTRFTTPSRRDTGCLTELAVREVACLKFIILFLFVSFLFTPGLPRQLKLSMELPVAAAGPLLFGIGMLASLGTGMEGEGLLRAHVPRPLLPQTTN